MGCKKGSRKGGKGGRKFLLVLLLAVSGWGKEPCNPNHPRCPKQIQKAKGTEIYCGVYSRGKAHDSAGFFHQAFPIEFCNDSNRTQIETDLFYLDTLSGAEWMSLADSAGKGFEISLTEAEKIELKKPGKSVKLKSVKLRKILKKKVRNLTKKAKEKNK